MHNNTCFGIYLYLYSEGANPREQISLGLSKSWTAKKEKYIKRAQKYVAPITGIDLKLLPVDDKL